MQHEMFLQAIQKAPDDDARRLAYADWLEAHGDPRGEFIRVQCAIEKRRSVSDRHQQQLVQLEARKRELLARHEREWAESVRGLAQRWEFRRGLLEEVQVEIPVFVEHAETLLQSGQVRIVYFTERQEVREVPRGLVEALAEKLDSFFNKIDSFLDKFDPF